MTPDQEEIVKAWTLSLRRPPFPAFDRLEIGNVRGVKTYVGGHQHGIVGVGETFEALESRLKAKFRPEVLA